MNSNYLTHIERTIEEFRRGFEKKYPNLEGETLYFMAVLSTQMALNGITDASFTELINTTAQNIDLVNQVFGRD